MIEDSLMLYKLIVLYMLGRVSFPLTNAQVCDFMLEHSYTDYMTLQKVLAELSEANLILTSKHHNRTQLTLTKEGAETLRFFDNRIGEAIRQDIDTFLKEKEFTLRNEVSILADYYKSTSGEYEARLVAKDRDITLIDMTLSVPTLDLAISVCDNWQAKNQEVYQFITSRLF